MDYRKIALCICTRNRPNELRKALASVERSTLMPEQTIVSDDSDAAQAEETQKVCAEQSYPVDYLRGPREGLSRNRNCCLDHLGDEIEAVAFIDDDVEITPDFLAVAATAMAKESGRALITGRENNNGLNVVPQNRSFWGHQEVPPTGPDDYQAIVINTCLFPRELFRQEQFDGVLRYGWEEVDMVGRARALGFMIRFVPELCNFHYPSPINRDEYEGQLEISRLYSQYKYFRWVVRDEKKAARFALLAPLHHLASIIKSGHFDRIPEAIATIRTAQRYSQEYEQSQNAAR